MNEKEENNEHEKSGKPSNSLKAIRRVQADCGGYGGLQKGISRNVSTRHCYHPSVLQSLLNTIALYRFKPREKDLGVMDGESAEDKND